MLTSKQTLFIKHYVGGMSGKRAAILAGYSARSAEVIASENLRKPKIRAEIARLLRSIGISDMHLRIEHAKLLRQDKNLSMKAKALDMFYKIRGSYKQPKQRYVREEDINAFFDSVAKQMGGSN